MATEHDDDDDGDDDGDDDDASEQVQKELAEKEYEAQLSCVAARIKEANEYWRLQILDECPALKETTERG